MLKTGILKEKGQYRKGGHLHFGAGVRFWFLYETRRFDDATLLIYNLYNLSSFLVYDERYVF